jgi:hypothetical protein
VAALNLGGKVGLARPRLVLQLSAQVVDFFPKRVVFVLEGIGFVAQAEQLFLNLGGSAHGARIKTTLEGSDAVLLRVKRLVGMDQFRSEAFTLNIKVSNLASQISNLFHLLVRIAAGADGLAGGALQA